MNDGFYKMKVTEFRSPKPRFFANKSKLIITCQILKESFFRNWKLWSELTKPASNLYRRNLAEQLETAIRSTNAQFDDPEVLKLLDVRLHEINPGDVGWDVFSLNYSVSGPLLTIFPTEVMRKYIRVFNFLLRAKRMEYNLNHLWGQMMSTSKRFKSALPEGKIF